MSAGSVRNMLREKVFNQKRTSKIVTLEDGVQIEVRQLTVDQMLSAVSLEDNRQRMVKLLIDTCYVPGTDERVFEDADFDSLMQMPAGGYYRALMDAANDQMLESKLKEAEGK